MVIATFLGAGSILFALALAVHLVRVAPRA